MPARFTWHGDRIKAKAAKSAATAVNAVMAQAVSEAKRNHAWHNRTGYLEASITIIKPAVPGVQITSGEWGAGADYSIYLEVGTSRKDSGFPRAQTRVVAAGGNMWDVSPPSDPPLMAPRLYLRPAAAIFYQRLPRWTGLVFRGEDMR